MGSEINGTGELTTVDSDKYRHNCLISEGDFQETYFLSRTTLGVDSVLTFEAQMFLLEEEKFDTIIDSYSK